MAVSFISNALGGTTTTTSFSITLPATAANDIIVLEFCHRGTGNGTIGGTYSGPAFTLKHSQLFGASAFSGKTYYSRATGNHTGQTVTGTGLTNSCAAIITIYRGALASGDPLAAATVVGEQNVSGNVTQAAISTTVADAWVVLVVTNSPDLAVATQACTTPGTLTERAERLSTGGTDSSIAHASAAKSGTGTTGAFTWTQTNAASGSWAYAIEPAAAGQASDDVLIRLGSLTLTTGSGIVTAVFTPGAVAGSFSIAETNEDGFSGVSGEAQETPVPGSYWYLGSNDGATLSDWGGIYRTTGITQGATILSATLFLTRHNADTGGTTVVGDWFGYDVDSPADFNAAHAHRISDHETRTTASVAESITVANTTHTTGSLVTILQEIVDRAGFSGDIGLTFRSTTGTATFWPLADFSTPGTTPVLSVTWDAGGAPPAVVSGGGYYFRRRLSDWTTNLEDL